MFLSGTSLILLVEALCGAAGGFAVGRWPALAAGRGNMALGAIGGLVLTWLAARIPHIGQLVGGVGSALDSVARNPGGVSLRLLAGVGISGLLGGVLSVLIRNAVRKRQRS